VFVNPDRERAGLAGAAVDVTSGRNAHFADDVLDHQDQLALEDARQGDGTDATRFTFRSLDAYGNQRPYPSGDVTLALNGPATLIADNPFPFATFGGVGGAFIRSQPGTSGTVTVTATHPALGQAVAQLTVEAASGGVGSPGVSAPTVVGRARAAHHAGAAAPSPPAPPAYPAGRGARLGCHPRTRGRQGGWANC
jgi:hypothetical protein